METGSQLKVSSDRPEKPGIEPATPGLQGKWLIHYTTAAPISERENVISKCNLAYHYELDHGVRHLKPSVYMSPH